MQEAAIHWNGWGLRWIGLLMICSGAGSSCSACCFFAPGLGGRKDQTTDSSGPDREITEDEDRKRLTVLDEILAGRAQGHSIRPLSSTILQSAEQPDEPRGAAGGLDPRPRAVTC